MMIHAKEKVMTKKILNFEIEKKVLESRTSRFIKIVEMRMK